MCSAIGDIKNQIKEKAYIRRREIQNSYEEAFQLMKKNRCREMGHTSETRSLTIPVE